MTLFEKMDNRTTSTDLDELRDVAEAQLREELIQSYIERYQEDKALNDQWEDATLEGWA